MKKILAFGSLLIFSNCLSASAKSNTETIKPSKNDSTLIVQPDTNRTILFPNPFLFLVPATIEKKG